MKKSVTKNYLYSVLNQIVMIVIPIITIPYFSRIFAVEGVGRYSFAFAMIAYFTVLAGLGFGYIAPREIAKYQNDRYQQNVVFWEIVLLRLFSVGFSLLLHVILLLTHVYGTHTFLMSILCLNIVAVAFDVTFVFGGNEEFGKLAFINIAGKIIATIALFVFVHQATDVWIYVLIKALFTIGVNLLYCCALGCSKFFCRVRRQDLHPWRHARSTLRMFLPIIAMMLYTVLDKMMLGVLTGSSVQNGYYEPAEKIINFTLALLTCLNGVMSPRNVYAHQQGQHEQVANNIYTAFHFVWLLGLPMTVGVFCVASNVIPWYLGAEFAPSILLLQIFAFLIVVSGLKNVIGEQYLVPVKRDRVYTWAYFGGAIINIVLNLPLIYFYQAVGACLATIISELVVGLIMLWAVRRELSMKNIFASIWKPGCASMIMFAVLYPVSLILSANIVHTLCLIGLGVVIYGICLLLLRDRLLLTGLRQLRRRGQQD